MHRSPLSFAVLVMVGGLLAGAGLAGGGSHVVRARPSLLGVCFVAMALGWLLMYWAATRLREDVQNERWPETVLAPFRRATHHRIWKGGMVLLFLALLSLLLTGASYRLWSWGVFFLMQAQAQLSNAFAPRGRTIVRKGLDWTRMPRLRSEHWGER